MSLVPFNWCQTPPMEDRAIWRDGLPDHFSQARMSMDHAGSILDYGKMKLAEWMAQQNDIA